MPERTPEEAALGYTFRDRALLTACFTHASVTGARNNERLEFLGDAVLELYVTEMLFRSSDAAEGALTERRKDFVAREALAASEARLGLMRYLRYAGNEENLRGKTSSNLYEAAVGAIYLDGGYRAAAEFLARTLVARDRENYKSALQEFVQLRIQKMPVYDTREDETGFVSEVCAMGQCAQGHGTTKKLAEQAAAKLLFGKLTEQ